MSMDLKIKQLRKFFALFFSLPEAADILCGKYDENQAEKEILSSTISRAYVENRKIIDGPENKFFVKLFDEINGVFYKFHESREDYIYQVLRDFAPYARFLNDSLAMEWIEPQYDATLNLLLPYRENPERSEDGLTDVEKYVISCCGLLRFFAETFDARCLHFGFDLMEIQAKCNIFILPERDLELLASSGYLDKVMLLINKQETAQKTLPEGGLAPDYPNENTKATSEGKRNNLLTLESVFADKDQYSCIMQLLVERNSCEEATFFWKDRGKGFKNFIVCILRDLGNKNYYRCKTGLSNGQIRDIALNTFHVSIAPDTIKHAKIDKSYLKFIPVAPPMSITQNTLNTPV
jgi:hypothetical protein